MGQARLAMLILMVALSLLGGPFPVASQTPSQSTAPVITADNIAALQSVKQLDFDALPGDIVPASGLFAASANATQIVTFGNRPGEPPLSQVILWGYGDQPVANAIDDSSLVRFVSPDGRCLYTGYRGYYAIWGLDATSDAARLLFASEPLEGYNVVNLWTAEAAPEAETESPCPLKVFAEVSADDGTQFILDPELNIVHDNLFANPQSEDAAARVGRIPPPLALTVDFEGMIYRWDMTTHQITARINVGEMAMFGSLNPAGTHYAWLFPGSAALHIVDFEAGTDREVAALDGTYISHLKLGYEADVIIGVDPQDAPGTVSAWLVETGERLDLGPYRACDRVQPDLAMISRDGTALVIGCDRGIDIWRVVED